MTISTRLPDFSPEDYLQAVSTGKVSGHSVEHVHSYSDNVDTNLRLIAPNSDEYVFKDTPSNLYLSSDDASDDQVVTIEWLDENYLPQTSSIPLNGQTPVLIGFGIRVNNATTTHLTATTGSVFVANALTHVAGKPPSADLVMCYPPGPQTRTMSLFTVPHGHTAFGVKGFFSVNKGKDCDFYWNTRNPFIPIPPISTKVLSVFQTTSEVDFGFTRMEARSDVWFSVKCDVSNARVSSRIIVVVVKNDELL